MTIDQTELDRLKALAEAAINAKLDPETSVRCTIETYDLGWEGRHAIPALIAEIERLTRERDDALCAESTANRRGE